MKRKKPYKKAILVAGHGSFALLSPAGTLIESQRLEDAAGYLDSMQHGESPCRRFKRAWQEHYRAPFTSPAAALMELATTELDPSKIYVFRLQW